MRPRVVLAALLVASPALVARPGPDKNFGCDLSAFDFSMTVECTLKAGTVVAIGPTQSADCAKDNASNLSAYDCRGKVPSSWKPRLSARPTHQVYLNTYGRSESELESFLTNCPTRRW